MVIFKKTDGSLTMAPEGFSIAKPAPDVLSDVSEIYQVSKVFVKEMKLVVKPAAKSKPAETHRSA